MVEWFFGVRRLVAAFLDIDLSMSLKAFESKSGIQVSSERAATSRRLTKR